MFVDILLWSFVPLRMVGAHIYTPYKTPIITMVFVPRSRCVVVAAPRARCSVSYRLKISSRGSIVCVRSAMTCPANAPQRRPPKTLCAKSEEHFLSLPSPFLRFWERKTILCSSLSRLPKRGRVQKTWCASARIEQQYT